MTTPVASAQSSLAPSLIGRVQRWLPSISAVLAGLVTTVVITSAVDAALHALGVFPPIPQRMSDTLFVLALAYRIPFNTLGCLVAARLAPSAPERHAYALALLGCALATAGSIAMWEYGPAWYALANIAVALPCAWLAVRVRALSLR